MKASELIIHLGYFTFEHGDLDIEVESDDGARLIIDESPIGVMNRSLDDNDVFVLGVITEQVDVDVETDDRAKLDEVEHQLDTHKNQIAALLGTIDVLTRERDLFYRQKQKVGNDFLAKRTRLQAIQEEASKLASQLEEDRSHTNLLENVSEFLAFILNS